MISISDFCDKHNACTDGRDWALANCIDMQDAWNKLKPSWLLWVATCPGVLTDKELRLFAVFCARQVEHLLTGERSKKAIEVAERFANGQATGEELAAARAAARDAACAAARGAAGAVARDACDAARDAAWAARDAAWAAAWAAREAAGDAARDAAWDACDAARDAAWAAQSAWLRANTKPRFEVTE